MSSNDHSSDKDDRLTSIAKIEFSHSNEVESIETQPQLDLITRCARKIPGFGIIMSLASGIAFAIAGFAVAKMPSVDPTFAMIYRSLIQLLVYGFLSLVYGDDLRGVRGERKFIFLRSVASFLGE